MAGSKSKNKGANYERSLSKTLNTILGGSWMRVPHSGAYVGGINSARMNTLSEGQIRAHKGDIIPPDNIPNIVIEAKNYAEFPFHHLLCNRNISLLDDWIAQTTQILDKRDKWFIMFKINRKGEFICFPQEYVALGLCGNPLIPYKDCYITDLVPFLTTNKEKIIEICN